MSKRTKKVGSAGRLGARYGVRIRRRHGDIEEQSKGSHESPSCKAVAMTRVANGIWVCRHCDAKYASSSYMPTPPASVKRELAEVLAAQKAKEEGLQEVPKEEPAEEELPRDERPKARSKE